MKREIIKAPDTRLLQKAIAVKGINARILRIIQDMKDSIGAGAGLAAPQIGKPVRIILVFSEVLINPEIMRRSGRQKNIEGCLSLPDKHYQVARPDNIKVKYFSPDGSQYTVKAHGLLVTVLCHEIDHLDGILIDSIGELVSEEEIEE